MSNSELPETLKWYRDSAQWILGLALGGLGGFAGLAGFSDRIACSGFLQKIIFALSGLCVVIAVIAGVLFNLSVASLGNAIEQTEKTKDLEENNPRKRAAVNRQKLANKTFKAWYWMLLGGFLISMLLFIVVGAWFLFTLPCKAEAQHYQLITPPFRPVKRMANIFLLNENTGQVYVFSYGTNVWTQIAEPPQQTKRKP